MRTEGGNFIMEGLSREDESRIKSPSELTNVIQKLGFLPLFKNNIPGFSVEEMTDAESWWSGNIEDDPWSWREVLAREGIVAYGKLFTKKSGFISREWYPVFANVRRNGYDFDSRYEDGLANQMDRMIYECLADGNCLSSFELKAMVCLKARKGTGFDTSLTRLQMQTYLTVRDFKRKKNKKGVEYGWAASVYSTPEALFGEKFVKNEYSLNPMTSKEKLISHLLLLFPEVSREEADKFLK